MEQQTIDVDAYAELKEIMGDTLDDVIQMYLDTTPDLLETLSLEIKKDNAEQVFEIAHRIKSSSASIAAIGIANIAETIEQIGRQGSTDNTSDALIKLQREYEELKPFLLNEIKKAT